MMPLLTTIDKPFSDGCSCLVVEVCWQCYAILYDESHLCSVQWIYIYIYIYIYIMDRVYDVVYVCVCIVPMLSTAVS